MTPSQPIANEEPGDLNTEIAKRLGWKPFGSAGEAGGHYQTPEDHIRRLDSWSTDRNSIADDLLPVLTDEQWKVLWVKLAEIAYVAGLMKTVGWELKCTPLQLATAWLEATNPEEAK